MILFKKKNKTGHCSECSSHKTFLTVRVNIVLRTTFLLALRSLAKNLKFHLYLLKFPFVKFFFYFLFINIVNGRNNGIYIS